MFNTVNVYLSEHAKKRMDERGISFDEVLEVLNDPKQFIYDVWNDVYIAVSIKGYAIVYAFRGSKVEVITVLRVRELKSLIKRYGNKRYRILNKDRLTDLL